jgi:hypothetical protein
MADLGGSNSGYAWSFNLIPFSWCQSLPAATNYPFVTVNGVVLQSQ